MHGVRTIGPNAENGVNPFGAVTINRRITTSGVASTALAAVDTAENPFEQVSVGDIIIVTLSGVPYERRVTVVTDDDNITVNANINIPAAGVSYSFRKFWYSSNPDHRMFIPVHGNRAANFDWAIDANANTGGVDMLLECIGQQGPEFPVSHWVQVQTTNTASGGTQAATTESMNLEVLPYTACRIGFAFGTGDDVDAADEDISVTVSLMR
jgi:hypothetical protein